MCAVEFKKVHWRWCNECSGERSKQAGTMSCWALACWSSLSQVENIIGYCFRCAYGKVLCIDCLFPRCFWDRDKYTNAVANYMENRCGAVTPMCHRWMCCQYVEHDPSLCSSRGLQTWESLSYEDQGRGSITPNVTSVGWPINRKV